MLKRLFGSPSPPSQPECAGIEETSVPQPGPGSDPDDGCTVSVEEKDVQGQRVIVLTANSAHPPIKMRSPETGAWIRRIEKPYHTLCKITFADGQETLDITTFSISSYWVAAPDDIPLQEDANRAMTAALRSRFSDRPDRAEMLVDRVEADWRAEHARFEECWATARGMGLIQNRLVFCDTHEEDGHQFSLVTPSTRQGNAALCGVVYSPSAGMYRWYDDYITAAMVTPISATVLATMPGYSGHEKLDLLTRKPCSEAMILFEQMRRR